MLSLTEVDCVCFDKTGTLTAGESYRPQFSLKVGTHWSLTEVRAIVASVEQTSDHPFAVALRADSEPDSRFQVRDVHVIAGRGISTWVDDRVLNRQMAVEIATSASARCPSPPIPLREAGRGEPADVLAADVKRGGLTSFEKSEIVEELKEGHRVLFVGDGFNDTQAMATADVSVAAAWGGLTLPPTLPTSSGRDKTSPRSSLQ